MPAIKENRIHQVASKSGGNMLLDQLITSTLTSHCLKSDHVEQFLAHPLAGNALFDAFIEWFRQSGDFVADRLDRLQMLFEGRANDLTIADDDRNLFHQFILENLS